MARHTFDVAVRWSDMDAYGHVNNVAYLTYLEEARVDMMFTQAGRTTDEKLGHGVVVAKHEIRYLAPLVFRPQPVRVETWVSRLGNASFTLSYEVRDDDKLYASASSVMVPYDIHAGRPRRISAVERAALTTYLDDADQPPVAS